MTELRKILNWTDAEVHKLFHALPAIIKKYGTEALHITQQLKAALTSPAGVAVETALEQIIPGKWEAEVIAVVTKALNIAIPGITGVVEHQDLPVIKQGEAFVDWLKGLSPSMQHAGLIKLLSGIFMALDPNLTEVGADTAAQTLYAHVTTK